ncbi:MAG: cytochrome c [Bdellovibrionales bacterium]
MGAELLARGKKHYTMQCAVCHGDAGDGKGTIASKMAVPPPSLISGKVLGYTEGRIFHAMTTGWGVMGSYSRQIRNEEDRWAVINYIKNLQAKAK